MTIHILIRKARPKCKKRGLTNSQLPPPFPLIFASTLRDKLRTFIPSYFIDSSFSQLNLEESSLHKLTIGISSAYIHSRKSSCF